MTSAIDDRPSASDTEPVVLARRLNERDLTTAVVTDPDGVLMGIVRLADLDQREP
jgi:hypothetical protein